MKLLTIFDHEIQNQGRRTTIVQRSIAFIVVQVQLCSWAQV